MVKKFYIETYGCQMNLSDSELITGILLEAGHELADSIDDTDLLFFNTCSVRSHAEERVLGRISNENSRKQNQRGLKIAVVGCMAQRMGKSLIEKGIGVDYVIGVDQYQDIPAIINSKLDDPFKVEMDSTQIYHQFLPKHQSKTCGFVTIMRGCNNFCSYCIVPYVRGRERSRPLADIYEDTLQAARQGLKDITLLGQNVNSYSYDGHSFADLLAELIKIEELYRLRFITSHPKDLSDQLIEVMASNPKISKHIHLPLQSGDSEVLARMNRKYTFEHYLQLIEKLRKAMPEIAITTDLIAGFPGETEAQFQNTLKAMRTIQFDHAFCFKYSNRDGTTAADFPDQVQEAVRLSRLQEMIEIQRVITLNKFQAQIGKEVEIYIEDISKKSEHKISGKTDDYKIAVVTGEKTQIGSLVKARVTEATAGTLICD